MTVTPSRLTALLLLLSLAGLPTALWAQTRSGTGRTKVQPQPRIRSDQEAVAAAAEPTGWVLALGPGFLGGGDLFVAESPNPIYWRTVSGVDFPTSRFTGTLDTGFQLGLSLSRRLSSFFSLRGDLGWSRQDVAAEALLGQTGAVFQFDRLTSTSLGLGLETRLVRLPSHPYLVLGAVLRDLSFDLAEDLNQSRLGAMAALGYRHRLQQRAAVAVELCFARSGFRDQGYLPETVLPDQVVTLESEDTLSFFGIEAKMELHF